MGEMGGNGGKCQKYRVGNVEKMCEIRRKLEENRRKMRQFGTNFPFVPVPFSPFFHSLATFPSGAFHELCCPNGRPETWNISDQPTIAELSASAEARCQGGGTPDQSAWQRPEGAAACLCRPVARTSCNGSRPPKRHTHAVQAVEQPPGLGLLALDQRRTQADLIGRRGTGMDQRRAGSPGSQPCLGCTTHG